MWLFHLTPRVLDVTDFVCLFWGFTCYNSNMPDFSYSPSLIKPDQTLCWKKELHRHESSFMWGLFSAVNSGRPICELDKVVLRKPRSWWFCLLFSLWKRNSPLLFTLADVSRGFGLKCFPDIHMIIGLPIELTSLYCKLALKANWWRLCYVQLDYSQLFWDWFSDLFILFYSVGWSSNVICTSSVP